MGFKLKILDNTVENCGILPCMIECDREMKETRSDIPLNFSTVEEDGYNDVILNHFLEDRHNAEEYFEESCKGAYGIQESYNISEEKKELNNSNIIRNISFDQSEILWNIMQLYNEGKPFDCDMTASELKFYEGHGKDSKFNIPTPKILFDVYPQDERVQKITPFEKLPLEDNSISSIICDLPFVISPKTCKSVVEKKEGSNMISNRFSSFYPMEELIENIYWWIKECYRVLKENGICVWKMQSTVSGGRQVWATPFSFLAADSFGFYVRDEFILEAKARLIADSKIKKQCHARKYTSTFWVFQKDPKKYAKNSISNLLKMCEKDVFEGKKWEIK